MGLHESIEGLKREVEEQTRGAMVGPYEKPFPALRSSSADVPEDDEPVRAKDRYRHRRRRFLKKLAGV